MVQKPPDKISLAKMKLSHSSLHTSHWSWPFNTHFNSRSILSRQLNTGSISHPLCHEQIWELGWMTSSGNAGRFVRGFLEEPRLNSTKSRTKSRFQAVF